MRTIFLCLPILMLLSCQDDSEGLERDPGYDFYPFEIGTYRVYEVAESYYTAFEQDSAHYYLKEVMADTLVSRDGSVKYLLYRYKSQDTTQWELDSIWAAQRVNDVVLVYELDVPYCKVAFPVKPDLTWDGNAFNGRESAGYYYESMDLYTVGEQSYGSEDVIRVVIEDIPKNLVNQDERSEVYVRGIGLVEKDYISVAFCQVGSGCEDADQVEQGRILRQVLMKYGKN